MADIASRSDERTRSALCHLLAEPDTTRLLDSLECLAVLAYLERSGVEVGRAALEEYPVTIDGWGEWLTGRGRSGAAG